MKHLTDDREPITLTDIDQAIADARRYLSEEHRKYHSMPSLDLVARLAAIVEDTYGQAHGPEFRTE